MTHPITPLPELVREWLLEANPNEAMAPQAAIRAAQWGADQELEACCSELRGDGYSGKAIDLRAARRPKPLSLKKQALEAWERQMTWYEENDADMDTIRRALEQLPND